MKLLSNRILKAGSALILFLLLWGVGCKEDPPLRDKYLGSFKVHEYCDGDEADYTITIIPSGASENAVNVTNIWNTGQTVSGEVVTSTGNLVIKYQSCDGFKISGGGWVAENQLNFNVTIFPDGGGYFDCTITGNRI
ncbi:MAG TPA: hypothetical protein P5228_02440 [Bacteroidales bacterium]|nr:hypothetical protein [Bacteroidales bacterium]HRZ48557.1 hypothetical protein [Bacteroidales bacterium]